MAESEISTWAEEIERKLMAADVSRNLAEELKRSVLKTVEDGTSARKYSPKMIEKAIAGEVIKLLDRGLTHFKPEKSTPSIVMFVGLPGSGKTTTVAKYAQFHQDEGFKVAIVCADTVGIDALSQIKNLANPGIFIYGSANEYDSAKVAVDGITKSISHKCDLVLIDTSGCGKQDAALFDAVRKVAKETNPDLVVLVWDCSIGQAAYEQAAAFKEKFNVGAVIVTKMDGSAKGGSALSAVVATQSPVTFIGTGTQLDAFKVFNGEEYISRLLGTRMMGAPKCPEAAAARFLICTLMSESFKKGLSEAAGANKKSTSHPHDILMKFFADGWNYGVAQDVSLADASVPVSEIEAAGYQAGLLAEALNNDGVDAVSKNPAYENLLVLWAKAGLCCGCYLKKFGFTGSL
ncbi:unnamed protein product [Microthlaspi erraticum]|jgi:signal recognition particle GTPase|uniref:SRP54-type proteins GTP-binding domain-containing protein n=1 Tax=Microthlaspi erraticum TaxID=1685480 RepID=A0A6D2J7M4_9BRAS|nr:unnamed protein product [Microthlaspi erraticum]